MTILSCIGKLGITATWYRALILNCQVISNQVTTCWPHYEREGQPTQLYRYEKDNMEENRGTLHYRSPWDFCSTATSRLLCWINKNPPCIASCCPKGCFLPKDPEGTTEKGTNQKELVRVYGRFVHWHLFSLPWAYSVNKSHWWQVQHCGWNLLTHSQQLPGQVENSLFTMSEEAEYDKASIWYSAGEAWGQFHALHVPSLLQTLVAFHISNINL